MSTRYAWIALVAVTILAMMVGCSESSENSAEVAAEVQRIQATVTAIRAQLAQNRARIEGLERSVADSGASSDISSATQDADATMGASTGNASQDTMQEALIDLSARVAEMEIFISELMQLMKQIRAGVRPGG